jgi:hypothetical protein
VITVTEKIREHFRKNPQADVKKAAAKFAQPVSRIYQLRKEVQQMPLSGDGLLQYAKQLSKLPSVPVQVPEDGEDDEVEETLDERAKDYGKFKDGAALMQGIKRLLADHAAKHDKTFADDQWEALEMIVHKIGRIVNGNPDKVDHWLDIAGYAKLVAYRLEGVEL